MTRKTDHEFEVLRPLIPLRVSDDVTMDEAERVDQAARYSECCQRELESFKDCCAVLAAAGAEPTPVDCTPSLWDRIEPRLGPCGRMRRRPFAWVGVPHLAAACVALFIVNVGLEWRNWGNPNGGRFASISGAPFASVGSSAAGANVNWASVGPVLAEPPPDAEFFRPMLGVMVEKSRKCNGAEIFAVLEGTVAQEAGLRKGDVILSVDGKPICYPGCLIHELSGHRLGQELSITLRRNGKEEIVKIRLGAGIRVKDENIFLKPVPIVPAPEDMPVRNEKQ